MLYYRGSLFLVRNFRLMDKHVVSPATVEQVSQATNFPVCKPGNGLTGSS